MPKRQARVGRTNASLYERRSASAACSNVASGPTAAELLELVDAAIIALDAGESERPKLRQRAAGDDDDRVGCSRLRAVVEDRDGRIVFDGFDAAEVDADGRIAVLLAFGPAPIPFP